MSYISDSIRNRYKDFLSKKEPALKPTSEETSLLYDTSINSFYDAVKTEHKDRIIESCASSDAERQDKAKSSYLKQKCSFKEYNKTVIAYRDGVELNSKIITIDDVRSAYDSFSVDMLEFISDLETLKKNSQNMYHPDTLMYVKSEDMIKKSKRVLSLAKKVRDNPPEKQTTCSVM